MKSRAIAQVTGLALGFGILGMPVRAECQFQKTTASDAAEGDRFGLAVATDADYLVVGAPINDPLEGTPGAAYVFKRESDGWVQQAKLTPEDPQAFSWFGNAISISGDVAVVGARFAEESSVASGAVYVFRRAGTIWLQEAKLVPGDAGERDEFGRSVAIDGDYILVGSPSRDGAASDDGAAYVFHFDGSSWIEQATLTPADAEENQAFGFEVSLSGPLALILNFGIGTGHAYVFRRESDVWLEEATLIPGSQLPDDLPADVSIDGGTAVLGFVQFIPPPQGTAAGSARAPRDGRDNTVGSVYVFVRNGAEWAEEIKLVPSAASPYAQFGYSVAVEGNVLAVGAPEDVPQGPESPCGSTFLFERLDTGWIERAKLAPMETDQAEYFGRAVDASGPTIIVGAPGDDDACPGSPLCESGSAFIYTATTCGVSVPSISEWGLLSLSVFIAVAGAFIVQRRACERHKRYHRQNSKADRGLSCSSQCATKAGQLRMALPLFSGPGLGGGGLWARRRSAMTSGRRIHGTPVLTFASLRASIRLDRTCRGSPPWL